MKTLFHAKHRFGPTDTIRAAIRRYNDKVLTTEELEQLTAEFIDINTQARSHPRVGDVYMIPVLYSAQYVAGPREIDGLILPEVVNVPQENESSNVTEPMAEQQSQVVDSDAVLEEASADTFPAAAFTLLARDYPHHFQMLEACWGTANFVIYLNRIIRGAGQVGWPKENYDEIVSFSNQFTG